MPSESELALRGRRASLPTSQHASAHHSAVEQASQQGRLLASQEARLLLRRSINQSVTQPACQLINQSTNQPINQSLNLPASYAVTGATSQHATAPSLGRSHLRCPVQSKALKDNQGRSHLRCPVRGTHVEHRADALVCMHRDRPAVQCMHTAASAGGGKGGAEQACREGSAGGAHLMREAINRTQSQACREGWAGGAHRLLQLEQSKAIKGNQGRSREIEGDRTAFCSWSTRRV